MKLFQGFGAVSSAVISEIIGPGMVLMNPTSIDNSGGSASITADGQVTFSGVTTLSLNGVFTSNFNNYFVSVRHFVASGDVNLDFYLRSNGVNNTSSYTRQYYDQSNSSYTGGRSTSSSWSVMGVSSASNRSGSTFFFYGPFLTQPTAMGGISAGGISGAFMRQSAGTHSQSVSYDGFTFGPNSSTMTGAISVLGIRS